MQIALHDQGGLSGPGQRNSLDRGGGTGRRLDQPERGDIRAAILCHLVQPRRRADQHRDDQPGLCRGDGPEQREGIDRMDHRRHQRRTAGGARDQLMDRPMMAQSHIGQRDPRPADFLGRRPREGGAGDHRLAMLVGADGIEHHVAFFRLFLAHRQRHRDGVADADRMEKTQILAEIDRARAGQHGSQHIGDQPRPPHPMDDDVMKHVGLGIAGIHMRRVHIAGGDGEQVDIALRHGVGKTGLLADGQFVEGPVLDEESRCAVHDGHLSRM